MSAELWGAGVKLKWVTNRAIFQGITAAEAGRAKGQKAPKRHMWKGPRVALGLVSRAARAPPLLALPKREGTLLPASAAFILRLLLRAAAGAVGTTKHRWRAAPSSAPLCLCSLKWAFFY